MKTKNLILCCLLAACLAAPLPADITISTSPPPSAEDINMINQAILLLVQDPRLVNHPINRYFHDPNVHVYINVYQNLRNPSGAGVIINLNSGESLGYYIRAMIHESIHTGLSLNYGTVQFYTFFSPVDMAFWNLMDEAFALAFSEWAYYNYPEIPRNRQIDAINEYLINNNIIATEPGISNEEINNRLIARRFETAMIIPSSYIHEQFPDFLEFSYNRRNTMLIPQYEAYRPYGDRLNRHFWDYLSSILPFELPAHMTYDYFRSQFMNNVNRWAAEPGATPNNTVLHWINFDAAAAARARLASIPENQRDYQYLSLEDEQRLNRIILEIDPFFTPVDTSVSRHLPLPSSPPSQQPSAVDTANTYLQRGNAAREREDWDTAIKEFTEAIRLNPNFSSAYYSRGLTYHRMGNNDQAISDYTNAIRIHSNTIHYYIGRGIAYHYRGLTGDIDRAIADFEAALRIDPNYENARNWLNFVRPQQTPAEPRATELRLNNVYTGYINYGEVQRFRIFLGTDIYYMIEWDDRDRQHRGALSDIADIMVGIRREGSSSFLIPISDTGNYTEEFSGYSSNQHIVHSLTSNDSPRYEPNTWYIIEVEATYRAGNFRLYVW